MVLSKRVTVTAYVNPHLFWIFEVDNSEQRTLLHKQLEQSLKKPTRIKPQQAELVAVFDNKIWKRGQIINVFEDNYDCWLVDYGIICKPMNIYKLPCEFTTIPAMVHVACLNNIVELTPELQVETGEKVYKEIIRFSLGICSLINDYIFQAEHTIFTTERVIDQVFCGQLELTKNGVSYNLIEKLLKDKCVAVNPILFGKAFTTNNQKILQSHNYKVYEMETRKSKTAVKESVGIGRGYSRNIKNKEPNHRSSFQKSFVQTWVEKNNQQIINHKLVDENQQPTLSSSFSLSSDNIADVSIDSDKLYEDVDEINLQHSPKSKSSIDLKFSPKNNENENVKKEGNEVSVQPNLSCMQLDPIDDDFCDAVEINDAPLQNKNSKCNYNDPFNDSIKNSELKDENNATRRHQRKSNYDDLFSDSEEDSPRLKEDTNAAGVNTKDKMKWPSKEEGRNSALSNTSISSKLPGFNILPAGASLANRSKKEMKRKPKSSRLSPTQKLKNKPPSDDIVSSNTSSSGSAYKNRQSLKEPLSESSSDSEWAPQPQCDKNVFTIGCKCENCKMWNENDIAGEYNTYKDSKGVQQREIVKPSPLFRSGSDEKFVDIKTKKFRGHNSTKIERDIAPTLLVHGFCIPAPANKINDVPFNESVLRALTKLKFSSAKSIQCYAWPAIMRQMNVCMVNAAGTGKTVAYLPAICSYVLELSERYGDLPKADGPLAIILCKGVKKVEETYDLFCNFRAQLGKRINLYSAAPPLDINNLRNIKTCDILISTPSVLTTLLKSRIITLKRLCHFVVEETDQILTKFAQEFEDLTNVVQSMLEHRSCIYGVQVVICSEHWTVPLENFAKKLNSTPLICIGAYLESALYGRADIQIHFVQSKLKLSKLCDILKEKSHVYKTIVVCNEEDEIDILEEYLRIKGVSVTSAKSTLACEEIHEIERMWENTVCGKHTALICTDGILQSQLSITSANMLVHYSLPPDSWTQFSRRFKCLVDTYECPFNSKNSQKCEVHVFVDEECNKQFPRIYSFLQTMGANVPEKFFELCEKIKRSQEVEKLEAKLCAALKLFGKCDKIVCKKRHVLSHKDVSAELPQNGVIKFKLLNVNDVSVFTVQLLEHREPNGKEVHKYSDNVADIDARVTQAVKENQIFAKKPEVGALFAWFDAENNAFHRCEIVKVLSVNEITKLADVINIKLIDLGGTKKTSSALLFELPEVYKNLPAQGVEVRLANMVPPDRDNVWSFYMKSLVKKLLDDAGHAKSTAYFTGRIVLQVADTLWLEDVVLFEDLPFSNEIVTKLVLKKRLLDKQLACYRPEPLSNLYDLCKSAGINLQNYECAVNNKKVVSRKIDQVKPQWSHLDEENLNSVYFCLGVSPHLFYVRLEKFFGLFQKLQKEIQKLIRQPHYPVVNEVLLGNCYLVKELGSDEYCRAIVTEIHEDTVTCFYVDFGDEACVFKNEIKYLPDEYITKLPFQAIECKLFGITPPMESWPDEATDVLYQYCFEPQSDIYRSLYISTLSSGKNGTHGCRNYSVLLVDYYSRKPVVVNKILIDCGFALPTEGVCLDNMKLPECQEYNDEQDDDFLDVGNNENETIEKDFAPEPEEIDRKSSSHSSNSDGVWDIEVNNAEEFLTEFMGKKKKEANSPKNLPIKQQHEDAYPIKAFPPAKYHTPNVLWHQTDRHVKIDIKLSNVTNYALHVLRKRIFTFSTINNGKEYKLNFQLFDDVEKTFQHSSAGLVIRVTLEKSTSIEWLRLTSSEQKFRYIKYDVTKCNFPEEKKRLFLQIDDEETNKDDKDIDNYCVIGSDEDYSVSDLESDSSD